MMLLRANVIAKGYSGARPVLVDLLLGDARTPASIRRFRSREASAPAATSRRSRTSRSRSSARGRCSAAASARPPSTLLARAGLAPGDARSQGRASRSSTAPRRIPPSPRSASWMRTGSGRRRISPAAMTLEALLGTPVAFDPRIQDARGQLGQAASAALLRVAARRQRDSRVAPRQRSPRPGCVRAALHAAGARPGARRASTSAPASSAGSSMRPPTIRSSSPTGELLSGGNFHGQAVAMALDFLAIAMTNLATMSRAADRSPGAPRPQPGPAALPVEGCRGQLGLHDGAGDGGVAGERVQGAVAPASVDTIPTDGNKEDVVPMAMGAAWKLRRIVQQRAARAGDRADVRGAGARLSPAAPRRPRSGAGTCAGTPPRGAARAGPRAVDGHRGARRGDRARPTSPPASAGSRTTAIAPAAHRRASGARAARRAHLVQGVAAGGRPAHADEQPRSRRRRASRRSGRVRRHGPGRAELGVRSTPSCASLRALDNDETLLVQSGKPVAVFRTHRDAPRVLIANSQPRGPLGDVGALPRARAARA